MDNKHDVYRCKDCKRTFCQSLRPQVLKKLKEMTLLAKEQQSHMKMKNTGKLRDHSQHIGQHRGTAHNICNLRQRAPQKCLWFFIIDETMITILL